MHLAIYGGTDAQAIVHAHPPMVLVFSLNHRSFVPLSFEEKYTIGEVPIVAQDTPTVTRPEQVVEELKYQPVVIIKGHGTVAIGRSFQEAFLVTDLLEEAVRCQLIQERGEPMSSGAGGTLEGPSARPAPARYRLFSREHMEAMVEAANADAQFRAAGAASRLTTSLTLALCGATDAWTVKFANGAITELQRGDGGDFVISGEAQWWNAIFNGRMDAFLATQQGKLKLTRGDLAQLSRWYKPFERAFTLWQTIPVR
jgi:putative sterol carrier protein